MEFDTLKNYLLQPIAELGPMSKHLPGRLSQHSLTHVAHLYPLFRIDNLSLLNFSFGSFYEVEQILEESGVPFNSIRFKNSKKILGYQKNHHGWVSKLTPASLETLTSYLTPDTVIIKAAVEPKKRMPQVNSAQEQRGLAALLPKDMKEGVGPKFEAARDAVINDPKVRDDVRTVLVDAIHEQLGLDNPS